jgi:hypothetical protein
MSITWADVQVIAPELSNTAVPTGTQAVLLAMVDRQIDDTAWDDLADDGRRYLAAHLGTVYVTTSGGGAASVGSVQSETVGPMSRTYVSSSNSSTTSSVDALLGTTRYGLWYLHMIRLLPCSMGFVP